MVKIAGYTINEKKKIIYSLNSIFGVGKIKGLEICSNLNLNPQIRWKALNQQEQLTIIDFIEKNLLTGKNFKREINQNIQKYKINGSFRGFRHKYALPVHGQRTHSNAKTYKRLRRIIKTKKTKKKN